jgi:hypothetical protein
MVMVHYVTAGTVCMAFQYKCSSGQCVPAESVCNGTTECNDLSDERNCPCKREEFRCRDGTCINIALRCDGYTDCHPQGEDELNCGEYVDGWVVTKHLCRLWIWEWLFVCGNYVRCLLFRVLSKWLLALRGQ